MAQIDTIKEKIKLWQRALLVIVNDDNVNELNTPSYILELVDTITEDMENYIPDYPECEREY